MSAHDQRGDRGFAAAGLSDDSCEAVLRHSQAHIVKYLALAVITEADVLQFDLSAVYSHVLFIRLLFSEEAEDLITCRHAVHRHMEIASEAAHGKEEVRRQKDHENDVGKADPAP